MPLHETNYLKDTVGDALARACAACVESQPLDPVEYTARYLLSYVKNAQAEGEFYEQKRMELEAKKKALADKQAEAETTRQQEDVKKLAIQHLAASKDLEPRQLLQTAVDLIKGYTSASAAYAAVVAEPEEADWTLPEDPEDPTYVESEDEEDPAPKPPPVEGEGAEGEEGAAAEEEAPAEEEPEEEKVKIEAPLDYSKKYISYVVATQGQEFMTKAELLRPPPPPEDADEDFKPEPVPFTFKILDERMPMVYSSNVAFENSVKFFQNFPRIGAYTACGVQLGSRKEFKAIIAADTLFPEGGGQPLSEEELDFIWELTLGLQKAYNAVEKTVAEKSEGKDAKAALEALTEKIFEAYNPPPPPPAEGEEGEGGAPAAEAAPEPAAEGEGEEGEGGGEAAEIDPEADPVGALKAEVNSLNKEIEKVTKLNKDATKSLELAEAALAVINQAVSESKEAAIFSLRHMSSCPQATFHILKAVFFILGKDPESFQNWKRAYEHFTVEVVDELVAFKAQEPRDMDAWNKARLAYKAVAEPKKLQEEMPETYFGVLLTMWIKQVRKVARRAELSRGHVATLAGLTETLTIKSAELEEAEKKKAEAEAEAARIAEEEAAKAAAEGGEEGEGEEGEEEED